VKAYLGLGTNLGDRRANLDAAIERLRAAPDIAVTALSPVYETAPVGVTDQPNFYNMAVEIETALPPDKLLAAVLGIEREMGRVRTVRWGPRLIDIDILLYGEATIDAEGLTVPHPRMAERAFVLAPLADIAPALMIPGSERTVQELVNSLGNLGNVLRVPSVS
jgi:2-amino-4-hydroxy-6-hydroxymethyldihydropteridine diphosphokinase